MIKIKYSTILTVFYFVSTIPRTTGWISNEDIFRKINIIKEPKITFRCSIMELYGKEY